MNTINHFVETITNFGEKLWQFNCQSVIRTTDETWEEEGEEGGGLNKIRALLSNGVNRNTYAIECAQFNAIIIQERTPRKNAYMGKWAVANNNN